MAKRGPKKKFTPELQPLFIAAFKEKCTIKRAAEMIGISREVVYDRIREAPAFKAAIEQAIPEVVDTLEAEADRRAVEGVLKPVFYKGERCGSIREFSDTLLIVRLKALAPEKYRERSEISGPGGGPIDIAIKTIEAHLTQ